MFYIILYKLKKSNNYFSKYLKLSLYSSYIKYVNKLVRKKVRSLLLYSKKL